MNFDSFEYWENRYKSDPKYFGKDWDERIKIRANTLNKFIKKYKIKKVFDYGCGDGRQSQYTIVENYFGVDISSDAIKGCKKLNPEKQFYLAKKNDKNLKDLLKIFKPDLSLSFSVISHLIEDEIFEEYMENLFCSEKFVIIYSLDQDKKYSALYQKDRHFTKYIYENFKNWKFQEFKEEYAKDIKYGTHIYKNDKEKIL